MKVIVGDIVNHQYRKSALYLVVEVTGANCKVVRVKKQRGYPIAGARATYNTPVNQVTKVAHERTHENITTDKARNAKQQAKARNHTNRVANYNPETLTDEIKSKFQNLAGELSPENLCCDGELPRAMVNRKRARLNREWVTLEKRIGRQVSEDEVWDWVIKDRKVS